MAGAREAHGLITALVARGRRVIASLPEPERMFDALPVPTRVGGFTSDGSFARWIKAESVTTVIDASHVFDVDVSDRVARVCSLSDLRHLRISRPEWSKTPHDQWHDMASIQEAARSVPRQARVFTNTGWPTLPEYVDFRGQSLFMRQTQNVEKPVPYPFVRFITGAPPFTQFQEEALFSDLEITHLICRNVGGAASMSKLLAARAMGLPVYMIARPAEATGTQVVQTVAEALAWEAQA